MRLWMALALALPVCAWAKDGSVAQGARAAEAELSEPAAGRTLLQVKRLCLEPSFKGISFEIVKHKPLWDAGYTMINADSREAHKTVHGMMDLADFQALTRPKPPSETMKGFRRLMGLRRLAAEKADQEGLTVLERAALANCVVREYLTYDAGAKSAIEGILSICNRDTGSCSAFARLAEELLGAMKVEAKVVQTGGLDYPQACGARASSHEMVDFRAPAGQGLERPTWLRMEPQFKCNGGEPCRFGVVGMECPRPVEAHGAAMVP